MLRVLPVPLLERRLQDVVSARTQEAWTCTQSDVVKPIQNIHICDGRPLPESLVLHGKHTS